MIKKKICMLGSFAVGKTSLVRQFVQTIFSEKYHTTIGVKIDQKTILLDNEEIVLLLWDIHGEDDFQKVKASYLVGASGYLLVVDGTRLNTLETAVSLQKLARDTAGDVPFVVLMNKADLEEQWEVNDRTLEALREKNWPLLFTSAKTGAGVEEAFMMLAQKMTHC